MACFRKLFSAVHPKFKTPHWSTWIAGFAVGIPAGIVDIGDAADLVEHRDAVRLRAGFAGRDHPAAHAARPPARLPRAVRAVVPADFGHAVRRPDDRADRDHLAPLRGLARRSDC